MSAASDPAPLLRRPIPPHLQRRARVVILMRFVLPAVAALLLAALALWSRFGFDGGTLHLNIGAAKLGAVDLLVMSNPHFEGVDEKNEPFNVTADSATQVDNKADVIDLAAPQADITLQNGTWLTMTADSGRFRRHAQTLDLLGAVNVFQDQGYELHTRDMHIDLAKNLAISNEPVEGHGPSGDLKAEGLEMSNGGKIVKLLGHAEIRLLDPAQVGAMAPKP